MSNQHIDQPFLEMMAVVKDKPEEGFHYVKKSISTSLEPHEVLIKVLTASFCGTDYHIYSWDEWSQKRLKLPLTVGHEFSGEIIKKGSAVTRVELGDIVSAETHIICGECEFCLRGEGHICKNTKIIGVDTDGCFARYVKIPEANCFINDKSMNMHHLSVQEPLGNAVHTMSHFDVRGKDVAILGCGPIGLMGVDVAKALGAKKVIAIEVNDYRRNLAKRIGADLVINPKEEDVIQTVLNATNGVGVDVIGEFSGNKTAIEQAFKYLKPGGGISMLGIPSKPIELDFANDIVFRGVSIYGVVGRRIYDTWYQVKELIHSGKLHLDQIITHEFPLSDILIAAKTMGERNCGKIILIPGDEIIG
ncbi:MAG: L-threonine 3-dehydrogenase [Candidatus Izemoplasmatales bacterium]|nr:L-threonine 3-dehydrogenase [Candidatus Izemoplasmatales bacterium]